MDMKEFSLIRHHLGKTQSQLAQLLSVSPKAIQSFEQGWRNVPPHIERHLLFLLYMKRPHKMSHRTCWVVKNCPLKIRESCPAWEFRVGYLCWFINGTICHGKVQNNWREKIKLCRQCEVFRFVLPLIQE